MKLLTIVHREVYASNTHISLSPSLMAHRFSEGLLVVQHDRHQQQRHQQVGGVAVCVRGCEIIPTVKQQK